MPLVPHSALCAPGTPARALCPWYHILHFVPLVLQPRALCPWYPSPGFVPLVLQWYYGCIALPPFDFAKVPHACAACPWYHILHFVPLVLQPRALCPWYPSLGFVPLVHQWYYGCITLPLLDPTTGCGLCQISSRLCFAPLVLCLRTRGEGGRSVGPRAQGRPPFPRTPVRVPTPLGVEVWTLPNFLTPVLRAPGTLPENQGGGREVCGAPCPGPTSLSPHAR